MRCSPVLLLPLLALLAASPARATCDTSGLPPGTEVAEIDTPLGSLCIELLRDDAPLHVENFLFYLDSGLLVDTFFHRSVPGFVVQGGGFTVGASDYEPVPNLNGTVMNEPCALDVPDPMNPGRQICSERGNERGTVALAKVGGAPDSGSTNWFVNLVDNRSNLDNQNGGFTVFGRLVDGSIAVADAMAALPIATPDDLAWMESAFQLGQGVPVPLLQPPLATPFGCWDPAQQAVGIAAPSLPSLQFWADPVLTVASFPFLVSASCGTPIPPPASAADLPANSCPDPGGVAVRVTGPRSFASPTPTLSYASLTCAQVTESFDQRAQWLAAYRARFNNDLVFIESATVSVVAGAVPSLSTPGAFALAGLVLGSGLRALRRARSR